MILHNILSARRCDYASSPRLHLLIDATLAGERDEFPFVFDPDDNEGLSPAVKQWLADHPDFEIAPYVEPEPALLAVVPVSLQQVAGARLVVDQDNWDVSGVDRCTGISGAFLADVDTVFVFFKEPQPDEDYEVVPVTGITKHTEYVEVTRPGLTDIVFIIQRVQ
jgi:hypothetical protein